MIEKALMLFKKKIIFFLKNLDFIYIICFITILLPNTRSIFKYIEFWKTFSFGTYSILLIAIIFFIKSDKSRYIRKFFSKPKVTILIILFLILLTYFMYPFADDLKYQFKGSDQDDCVIMGVRSLYKLVHPYSQKTFLGNVCSTGLGMIVMYFPFVLSGFYPLGAIFSSIFSVFSIASNSKNRKTIFYFVSLILFSIFWMELLIVGSDLILFGSGLVIISYGLIESTKNKDEFLLIVYSIIGGLLSSSRINFLILIPIFSIYIFTNWKKGGIFFFIISFNIAIIPSGFIYILDPEKFMPLHLLGKSDLILKNGLKEIGFLISFINSIIGFYLVQKNIENLPIAILISLFPGLFLLSIGDFIFLSSLNPAIWEGANYFMPIFPLAAAILSNKLNSNLNQNGP